LYSARPIAAGGVQPSGQRVDDPAEAAAGLVGRPAAFGTAHLLGQKEPPGAAIPDAGDCGQVKGAVLGGERSQPAVGADLGVQDGPLREVGRVETEDRCAAVA